MQMAPAAATFSDSSPPGWAMRTVTLARAVGSEAFSDQIAAAAEQALLGPAPSAKGAGKADTAAR